MSPLLPFDSLEFWSSIKILKIIITMNFVKSTLIQIQMNRIVDHKVNLPGPMAVFKMWPKAKAIAMF